MKKLIYAVFVIQLTLAISLNAQIHDFDSLITANPGFERVSKTISDTLDLFNDDSILRVTLESDFKNLLKQKYKEEYQAAVFRMMFNDTVQVSRTIKIRARANVRKTICFVPPLKLNFPKKDAFLKQIESFDKMKMVLDCKRGNTYEQYLLSEYYVYKIQNIINDYSLRVRLMQVNYIDHSEKFKNVTRYAFLIESLDQLAERLNAIRIETTSIRDNRTDIPTLADAYLFQYLIGNTDWSIPAMHNIYLIKSNESKYPAPYVIPFDFDYAGIVNTIYAIPDEQLGTESVRERVYRGVCISEKEVLLARERFLANKQKVYNLYESDLLLSKSNKKSTISYLNEFFIILENENLFRRNILRSCR